MARAYHLLLSRHDATQPFGIAFGDYDRAVVVAERQDCRDRGIKAKNLRIVTSNSANQSCCNYVCRYANRDHASVIDPGNYVEKESR